MKKLEDFNVEKIEIDSIYGGRMKAAASFDCNTMTIGGSNSGADDGSDNHWDD
ncbi:hypothetical protein [Polaribacter sp. 11A2H]|uniref:hypothetical protein n=1 Tax=Polaribacter sp. 11A2H TaxID=2687290 RepID=UPI0014073535|nr:hypothetical protein [Polaribacter sp. 11A2H]